MQQVSFSYDKVSRELWLAFLKFLSRQVFSLPFLNHLLMLNPLRVRTY